MASCPLSRRVCRDRVTFVVKERVRERRVATVLCSLENSQMYDTVKYENVELNSGNRQQRDDAQQ